MANKESNQERIIDLLKKDFPYLAEHYTVKKIGIFGSFAKGEQSLDSDLDLVLEFEKPVGLKFIDLSEHLEKLIGRSVEILTSEGLNSIRSKRIAEDIRRSIVYV